MKEEKKEKPTLSTDLKNIASFLKDTFKQPTRAELKEKIEISKLKTELAESEAKRKEANAKRWNVGSFKLGSDK